MCNSICGPHGRTVQTCIEDADPKFNLINVYAPRTNAERRIYFHSLLAYISNTDENILGDDFNCISDNKLDKLGGNPSVRQTATTILNTITHQNNLTDLWRDRKRDGKKHSKLLYSHSHRQILYLFTTHTICHTNRPLTLFFL